MAMYCPRTCGRLATAAIFISVGIIQIIAGIILLKSDYASMLCGPNVWTALSNIAVGILLGVASTVWKTINKNSSRHANRRKFLAALVSSIFILNSTTAAMLIIGQGNKLLAIYLDEGGTSEKEILAYAYSTSVCSPIVCVVVSIAFLTGICFRRNSKTIKTLDFKKILNEDASQIYDWVYTSNLPKPDPEILKAAISSESESSSSESDSDSSSALPVPLHLCSHSSLNEIKNSYHGSLQNKSLPFSATRNKSLESYVSKNFGEARSIPRVKRSSLYKTPVSYDESMMSYTSVGSAKRLTQSMAAYGRGCKPGTPIRIGASSGLENMNKLETPIREEVSSFLETSNMSRAPNRIGASRVFEKSLHLPNFQFNSNLSTCPKAKLSFSSINQGTPYQLQMFTRTKNLARDKPSTNHQPPTEDSTEGDDSVNEISESPLKAIGYSPNLHSQIHRTSTTDQTKVQKELENLDNSEIRFDGGIAAFKEIYLDETFPEAKDKERLSLSNLLTDCGRLDERNDSLRSGGDLSILVRNSNFRKKLSSKLVPATGPIVSDNHSFYKTSNRKSTRKGRVKPYSKSKASYDKYLQTGFSSFKGKEQVDEVDAAGSNSIMDNSVMISRCEKSVEEESDSFQPSTSSHTSGYMSASYEESEDESELKNRFSSVPLIKQSSPAQKLIADEIKERHRKRVERVSFELNER